MKKTLSIFIVLIAIASAVSARRLDKPEEATAMAITKSGSMIKLFYKGVKDCNVKVAIINSDNQIVFKEEIKHVDGFMRPYNFSKLPEGDYTIELIDHTGKKVEKVSYRDGKVDRLANLIKVADEDNKYLLTISNRGKDKFDVSIYDSVGTLIYNHSEEANGDFAQVYNLSKVLGEFSFVITDKSGNTKRIQF